MPSIEIELGKWLEIYTVIFGLVFQSVRFQVTLDGYIKRDKIYLILALIG